jgi:hypothetical protein
MENRVRGLRGSSELPEMTFHCSYLNPWPLEPLNPIFMIRACLPQAGGAPRNDPIYEIGRTTGKVT